MSILRNRVQLIGRLGKNPEIKNFESNKKLASISIATSEHYTNEKGERVEKTEWHNAVAWGKNAELLEKFVSKGQEIALEGKLTSRSYDDKEGVKRYVTEVLISEILLFGNVDKEKKPF